MYFVKTCEKCQLRKKKRYDRALALYKVNTALREGWRRCGIHASDGGWIWDDLSIWVEARPLKRNNALEVSTFLFEDIICRHSLPRKFVLDNGPENKDITKTLLENYNVKNITQSNGLVERGHALVVNALAKYCNNQGFRQWNAVLPLGLWTDRVTVRRSTGFSPGVWKGLFVAGGLYGGILEFSGLGGGAG
jgi:hypothetical protein